MVPSIVAWSRARSTCPFAVSPRDGLKARASPSVRVLPASVKGAIARVGQGADLVMIDVKLNVAELILALKA